MRATIKRFLVDQSGATAVEYALVAGIIALALIATLGAIRDDLNGFLNNTAENVK